jgi:hypothetical protein
MGRTACTEPQCLSSRAIPLLPLWAVRPVQSLSACSEPQCLYSRAISLLPLWAVRPVQSLSACTVELYLYSPYGPHSLYRASVPLQGCTSLTFNGVEWSMKYVSVISIGFSKQAQANRQNFVIVFSKVSIVPCHTLRSMGTKSLLRKAEFSSRIIPLRYEVRKRE